MKDYEDEAFDELEKSLQRKVAHGKKLPYPHEPQHTWVGLKDEEIGDEYVRFEVSKGGFINFEYATRAIEAKLKEKNT